MGKLNYLACALLAFALAGCGGGGGGSPVAPPPPPVSGPTVDDLANARSSAMAMVYSPAQSELDISWTDSFPAELGYRVEKQGSGSSWQAVETLPPASATGQPVSWKGALAQSATYRVVALRDGYVVPLEAAPGVTTGSIDPTSPPMTIEHDQLEPLREPTHFSIAGATGAATRVRYYLDNPPTPGIARSPLGTYTNAPTFVTDPQNFGAQIGGHTMYADVTVAAGVDIRLRRNFTVVWPEDYWRYFTALDDADVLHVDVVSGKNVSVTAARIYINGTEIPATFANIMYGQWSATFDASGLPTGTATLRLVLSLSGNDDVDVTRPVVIDRTPRLTVESPVDGSIVKSTLQLKGAITDDSPTVTTTVYLDDTQILQTTQNSFDQAYSLAGTPAGEHMLKISVKDTHENRREVTHTVEVVDATTPFTYQQVAVLPVGAQLLDSDGTTALYRLANYPGEDNRVFRHPATGGRVEQQGADAMQFPTAPGGFDERVVNPLWDLGGDRVAIAGMLGSTQAAFLFDATGAPHALPYPNGAPTHVGLAGSWVFWAGTSGYLRNLAASGPDIGPIDLQFPGPYKGFAFAGQAGAEKLFFPKTSGSADVGMWYFDVSSGTTTLFTAGSGWHVRPQSDGIRVAWEHEQQAFTPPYELMVAPFSSPGPTNTTSKSMQVVKFRLVDGTLAWVEPNQNQQVLKVDDATGGVDVSTAPTIDLIGSSGGNVLFVENAKLYVWSRTQGKRVLQPSRPRTALINGGVVFLLNGNFEGTVLYRVDL